MDCNDQNSVSFYKNLPADKPGRMDTKFSNFYHNLRYNIDI